MRHRFLILAQRQAGVVPRILGVLHARGLELEALRVAPLARAGAPPLAMLTLVTAGEPAAIERVAQKIRQQVRVQHVAYWPQTRKEN
ncbi:MAG TPA: hypothetical protein VMV31_06790 [Terriglobales bacterium]|nr:hypothetical protein [Terriglobales bacterium]